MARNQNNLTRRGRRRGPHREYKRQFFICSEGSQTEPVYFRRIGELLDSVVIKIVKSDRHHTHPMGRFRALQRSLRNEIFDPSRGDEAWLVIDRDTWPETQLDDVYVNVCNSAGYSLAVSNPSFDYWILLHFDAGTGLGGTSIIARLSAALQKGYEKTLRGITITESQIKDAISRAASKDVPPCSDWPREKYQTTVYRLIEKLFYK